MHQVTYHTQTNALFFLLKITKEQKYTKAFRHLTKGCFHCHFESMKRIRMDTSLIHPGATWNPSYVHCGLYNVGLPRGRWH